MERRNKGYILIMRMLLAQYTSPQKGNVGYRWYSKNPKIPDSQLDLLLNNIKNIFPGDGRGIAKTDLCGGFLFIPDSPFGIAFRFLDGGQDAKGRYGKVTINCAFFDILDCKGKTLAGIFDATFMTDLTEEGRNTTADFTARDYYNIVNPEDYVVTKDIKRIGVDELDKIYQICTVDIPAPMLIEVKSTATEKYAKLSPVNKAGESVGTVTESPTIPRSENINQTTRQRESFVRNNRMLEFTARPNAKKRITGQMKLIVVCFLSGFIVGAGLVYYFTPKNPPMANGLNQKFVITGKDGIEIGELVIRHSEDRKVSSVAIDFEEGIKINTEEESSKESQQENK